MASARASSTQKSSEARHWKKEIQLAGKREKTWRDESDKIVKRYRGEEKKRNRFNVLWANTEILRPALYNSRPNPDVRRRFRDADPVGKAVSEVLERSLSIFVDGYDFDCAMRNDVLDGLLCGRGLSRIRYIPKISSGPDEEDEDDDGDIGSTPPDDEEVESETTCLEHVDWKDFRHGYGRVWAEVPWVGFRHKLTHSDAKSKFGSDVIAAVQFTLRAVDDDKKSEEASETQKVAEFWEVWDKEGKRVFFTQEECDELLFPEDNEKGAPPLEFDGFFPVPEPLRVIENTGSLLPIPIFTLYQEQANELDKISGRIDKIVGAMRLRGIYDGKISEMPDLLAGDDNELTPVQNAQAWGDAGLDKAVSWFPTEKAADLLTALYQARDQQKAIIDEIVGIRDFMRGETDPNETATAQQLKSNFGSVRLQRMQKEVQRYARDLLRLAADVMAQKYSPESFANMTELIFPTQQQKEILQQHIQLQQAQPPQPGMPQAPSVDPAVLQLPTWDEIIGVMRSEKLRQYKVDVETDSTVAGTLQSDMQGLSQVLQAIAQTMQGLAPLVMDGALPIDAAKEVVLTVIRRARMGLAVEDAFDKMQAPKPQPQKQDNSVQAAQVKGETDLHVAALKAQNEQQLQQQREQAETQRMQFMEQMKSQREQNLEDQKSMREEMHAKLDASVKIIVAAIAAKTQEAAAEAAAERDVVSGLQ